MKKYLLTILLTLCLALPVCAGEFAVDDTADSASAGTLDKGLVGHWPLTPDAERLGANLHTDQNNAASDENTEADATTGFSSTALAGTGANVFESQAGTVDVGSYALHGNSEDTPTNIARFYKDIGTDWSLVSGVRYVLYARARHIGSNGNWILGFGASTNPDDVIIATITNTDTTFRTYKYEFEYGSNFQYFGAREYSGTNDGGVYVDDIRCYAVQAADRSGYGNHGTIYGADIRNHGSIFDGSDDYASYTVADWRSSDSAGTVAFSVKTTTSAYQVAFGSSDEAAETNYLHFGVDSGGRIYVAQREADTADSIRGGTVMDDGVWHRGMIVSSGTAYTIYLDGVSESLTAVSGSNAGDWLADTTTRDNIAIGVDVDGSIGDAYVNGNLADVIYWPRQLSAAEALDDYQGNTPPGYIARWPLSENVNSTFIDATGNGADMTISDITDTVGNLGYLDGTNDSIQTTSTAYSVSTISYSFWAKRDSATSKDTVFGGSGNTRNYLMFTDTGILTWRGDTSDGIAGTLNDNDTALHHYVVRLSSGTGTMFQDNVAMSMSDGSTADAATFTMDNLGERAAQDYFGGYLKDPRINDRVMSTDEVALLDALSGKQPVMTPGFAYKDLVGSWDLDSASLQSATTMADTSGYGNTITWSGTPVFGSDYTTLDGSTEWATITTTDWRISDQVGSVSAWFNTSSLSYNAIFSSSDTAATLNYFLFGLYNNGNPYFAISNGGSVVAESISVDYADGSDHFIVATSDGSTTRMYIDGAEATTTGDMAGEWFADITGADRDNVVIGAFIRTSTGWKFNGSLWKAKVHKECLTPAQVKALYDEGP